MTVQDVMRRHQYSEAELYAFVCKQPDIREKMKRGKNGWVLEPGALEALDQRLMERQRADEAEWADPADGEPDDNAFDGAPDTMYEDEAASEPETDAPAEPVGKSRKETGTADVEPVTETLLQIRGQLDATQKEKAGLETRLDEMNQEYTALQQSCLTEQSRAAARQAELLARASAEKKAAEAKITAIKEELATARHLASIRVKELEEWNTALEQNLADTHASFEARTEELMAAQHKIQQLTDAANKKGAEQELKILDAQRLQSDLSKVIHEKELALADAKERQQELLEKHNALLVKMGEIIGKIQKAKESMREISAEFDAYVGAQTETDAQTTETAAALKTADDVSSPETARRAKPIEAPCLDSVEIFGEPVAAKSAVPTESEAKVGFFRRVASYFF